MPRTSNWQARSSSHMTPRPPASAPPPECTAPRAPPMVYQLLAYTHEPNPVEPDLVGAETIPGQMQPRPVHRPWQIRLRRMQHRAALPRGFLARTGLDLAPFLYAPGLEVFSADAPMQ